MGAGARIAHHGPRIDRSMLQLETEYTCAVVPKKPKNGQLANEEGSIYGFPVIATAVIAGAAKQSPAIAASPQFPGVHLDICMLDLPLPST